MLMPFNNVLQRDDWVVAVHFVAKCNGKYNMYVYMMCMMSIAVERVLHVHMCAHECVHSYSSFIHHTYMTYIHINTYIHVYLHTCMYVHVKHVCVYIHVCMYVKYVCSMYVPCTCSTCTMYIHTYMYVCAHTCSFNMNVCSIWGTGYQSIKICSR